MISSGSGEYVLDSSDTVVSENETKDIVAVNTNREKNLEMKAGDKSEKEIKKRGRPRGSKNKMENDKTNTGSAKKVKKNEKQGEDIQDMLQKVRGSQKRLTRSLRELKISEKMDKEAQKSNEEKARAAESESEDSGEESANDITMIQSEEEEGEERRCRCYVANTKRITNLEQKVSVMLEKIRKEILELLTNESENGAVTGTETEKRDETTTDTLSDISSCLSEEEEQAKKIKKEEKE